MNNLLNSTIEINQQPKSIHLSANNILAQQIVEKLIRQGITEFCVCAGSRNSPLVYALAKTKQAKVYYWGEERSAAFFAIGRIKATGRPVAVVTTSGTAAAELLPATMSAYYLSLPLLLLTADRPRRFRLSGAPQSAEQVGLYTYYTSFEADIAFSEECDLEKWNCQAPAHLNICFEEPSAKECDLISMPEDISVGSLPSPVHFQFSHLAPFKNFLENCSYPFVVVGGLPHAYREEVINLLIKLKAPIYAEGPSNIREDSRLSPYRIKSIEQLWQQAEKYDYPIDGILRIGEIPTGRLWRDLEEKNGQIKVCSISEQPFSGLSWSESIYTSIPTFCHQASLHLFNKNYPFHKWLQKDNEFHQLLLRLIEEEPLSEPSLVFNLSNQLQKNTQIYLGNSLPIREWDLAAAYEDKNFTIQASRGVNGIDGQVSTFLGLCKPDLQNWAIIGDWTALYDMVGFWILDQLPEIGVNVVIINNGGGQIFSKMGYSLPSFTNPHQLNFEHLASFWGMEYEKWRGIPQKINFGYRRRIIELVPDNEATDRFWKKMATFL